VGAGRFPGAARHQASTPTERTPSMTDLPPDSTDRYRAVNDDIARKNRWLREIRLRTDSDGKQTPEALAEARKAAGIDDDERTAA
jgi:hypothetical protein